ncbi:MAG: NAD-dependent epimerase/dehydratase family protein [Fimbriimonadaceae bacterium]|nr:NAD-dependent epimerase/dehydratase family protein [Fimbriimonadaceae bacterium]
MLVTGGAGFIGSHLVRGLLARGDEVVVLDDLTSGKSENLPDDPRLTFVEGSILDGGLVGSTAAGCAGIFHLAAVASVIESVNEPVRTHRVNTEGTINLLEAAAREGARFVFSSSSAVYGEGPDAIKSETSEIQPLSPYAVQKFSSEQYVRVYSDLREVGAVCLRYFNVFGPRQNPNSEYAAVVPKFVRRALDGGAVTIFGDGEQTRDFVHVDDVVRANVAAFESHVADGRPINVASGRAISVNELAVAVFEALGQEPRIEYAPARSGEVKHSRAGIDALAESLGMKPQTDLRRDLAALADAMRTPD